MEKNFRKSPFIAQFFSVSVFIVFFVTSGFTQHLTISTGGDQGTSGTNWSITGNTLNVGATGSATIDPNVITNHLSNVGDLTVNLPPQGQGSSISRNMIINASISYTGGTNRTLTLNCANDMVFANATGITSSSARLNLVLRTALGLPDNGYIQMNGVTIQTNGGHFWAGGGPTAATWNGLTVGNSSARTWFDDLSGISVIGSSLNTSGGNIYMAGLSYNTSDGDGENYGINIRNSSISSASGQIDIVGDLQGMYGTGCGLGIFGNTGSVTINSTTGAINLTGSGVDQAGTNTGWRRGALLYTLSSTGVAVSSTSGNITITGTAAFPTNGNDDMMGLQLGSTQAIADGIKITSRTGNIVLTGSNSRENIGQNSNAVQFIAANTTNSIRVGYDGTNAYSGNITIEGNSIFQNNVNAGSGSIAVQTTGNLTMQPKGNTFTYLRAGGGTLTFDDDWNFGTTLGSFTFGKSTNTANLILSSPRTTSGAFTIYAGNITVQQNLTTTNANANILLQATGSIGVEANIIATAAANITLNANGGFYSANTLNTSNRKAITSAGGNITIHADLDANGSGVLDLDYLTINPGAGNTIIRGETFFFNYVLETDRPYINGTGNFTLESSDGSFGQVLNMLWFALDQDNNGMGALTIGKSTESNSMVLNHTTGNSQYSGPIQIQGGNVEVYRNLNITTAGQDILLKSKGYVWLDSNDSLQTNGGDIVLWTDSDNSQGSNLSAEDQINLQPGTSLISKGGKIILAGGPDVDSDSIPDAYAYRAVGGSGGINLGPYTGTGTVISILSDGGDILIKGRTSNTTSTLSGIVSQANVRINSGTGRIDIEGVSSVSHGIEFTWGASPNIAITSDYAGVGHAIRIAGGSSHTADGIRFISANGGNVLVQSTSTTGGGILMEGSHTAAGNVALRLANDNSTTNIQLLSGNGDIILRAAPVGFVTQGLGQIWSYGNVYFGSRLNATPVQGIIPSVISSNANVLLSGNNVLFDDVITKASTTGSFSIEPRSGDNSFSAATTIRNLDISTVSAFTSGKVGNTAALTISSALTAAAPMTFHGGAMTIGGALTATNNDINLYATGAVTQTAAIIANNLGLHSTGTFTLNNTSNNVATLAGGESSTRLGSLSFTDASGGLTIGTVGTKSGVHSSGTVLVETLAGDLTIAQNISTSNTTSNAIIINAGKSASIGSLIGGDIKISGSPTPALSMGTGGIAKLFSGFELNSTGLTNLAGGESNVRVSADETTTVFAPVLAANQVHAIYRTTFGTGDLTIVSSGGDAEGSTWVYENGVIKTINSTVNIRDSIIQRKLLLGDVAIEANKVTFSANIINPTTNTFKVLAKTHIVNTIATTISSNGGDVLLASNVDNATDFDSTTNGYIQLRLGATINTNGGDITLGGGNNQGSDYALGSSEEGFTEGVRMDVVANFNSGGGNIAIKGKSHARSVRSEWGASGIGFYSLSSADTISSGTGTILLDGYSQTTTSAFASGILFHLNNLLYPFTIQSANTTANAITINGYAHGTSGETFGIESELLTSLNITATGIGGGVTINAGNNTNNDFFDIVLRGPTNILANGGPISLNGKYNNGKEGGRMFLYNNLYLGSKAASVVPSSSSDITIQFDNYTFNGFRSFVATTGAVDWKSASASFTSGVQTNWFNWNQNGQTMSSFTLGKSGNTGNLSIDEAITAAGPINMYGGAITINAALTSSDTGNIFLKSIWNGNPSISNNSTITKSGGTGVLTMQGNARVTNTGTITTSGTGVMDVIMWSDYDNTNNDGGVSQMGTISTNGGHVWLGGSNTNGGSYTWNGLTIGNGPSIGASGYNGYALDFFGNITTNGGDLLAWAGNGLDNGIITDNDGSTVTTGSGDLIFIADRISGSGGASIVHTGTGKVYLLPDAGSYGTTLDWTHNGNLNALNIGGIYNFLLINNSTSITGLNLGYYDQMSDSSGAVILTNTSPVTISSPNTIAGPIGIYGGAIAHNANFATSDNLTGNILIKGTSLTGTGNLTLANTRNVNIDVAATSTYDGVISGTQAGLTKAGAGLLTLTKDHTYSGATLITRGNLQVGSGGSLNQASSGTINSTSSITIDSSAKLILAPNEDITFSRPVSGAGSLEIKGASGAYYNVFLTSTAATIATNATVLEILTRITGGLQAGAQVANNFGTQTAGAYIKSYNASTNIATLQFQQFDGTYTKCVFAELSQSGTNVQIRANTSIYNGAAYRNGNHLGVDMSAGSITIGALATSPTSGGYGISNVYMSGKVNFTGALTYSGITTLSNTLTNVTSPNTYSYTSKGTQEITDTSSSFPGAVVNNGLVIFKRATPLTIAGNMSGSEEILQVGAPITLLGNNTHSGLITIAKDSSLLIGSGGTTGSVTGNIVNYGRLTFNRSDSSAYPGILSGSGTLIKGGQGVLVMTGANTYTGATNINEGKLIFERDIPATASSSFSGAGLLEIRPASASFTNPVSYPISGFNASTTIGGLTIGKPGNTANISLTAPVQVAGPVSFYGGNITLNHNLNTTSGDANGDVLLKASANILLEGGKSITTNGGDVILWSNSDGGTSDGGAFFKIGSSVATEGGHIWIGGGNGNTTWNGLTVGNGFAVSGRNPIDLNYIGGLSDWYAGVVFIQTRLSSAGGNIYIAGQRNISSPSLVGAGVINNSGSGTLIDAGTGTVTLKGSNTATGNGDFGIMTGLHPNGYSGRFEIRSADTSATNAITIEGTSSAGIGDGILVENHARFLSTATSRGGGISISGTSASSRNALSVGIGTNSGTLDVLSASGEINLNVGIYPLLVASQGNMKLGSILNDTVVGSSTANVVITSNNVNWAGNVPIRTTGTLTVTPTIGNSFGTTLNTNVLNYTGITGLVLGNPSNSAGVTVSSNQTVDGPITIYSGSIRLNEGLTSKNNGDISLYSDNALLGLTAQRNLTAAGHFKYIPQSNSFSTAVTYPITNLNLSASGLVIGKTSNTANITIASNQSIAGPISIFGGKININGALTAMNSNLNLHARDSLNQKAPITASGLGLHGPGHFSLSHASNNVRTIAGGEDTSRLGSLHYVDLSGGLEIGSVNPTGIYAAGPVLIETTEGDIELKQLVSSNSNVDSLTGYKGAIVLNAGKSINISTDTGGDIVISGSGDVSAPNGIIKLYAGNSDGSTGLNSLVGGASNIRTFVDETTTTHDPVLNSKEKYAMYRDRSRCFADTASSTPTICVSGILPLVTIATTGSTGIGTPTGLPAGVTASWAFNTITIQGTPSEAGVFTYSIPLTGVCGTGNPMAIGTITVDSLNTVSVASSTPTLCINTPLTNITHSTTGATGIGLPTGLPAGITATWSSNVITLSGTPTASGTFNYIIPLTGGCGDVNATGIITVTPNNTVSVASSSPTVCLSTALNITHSTTGATGIDSILGLPFGVNAIWASNTITLSGTPTQTGIFNYSILLTGGCGRVIATGTINVDSDNTVTAASSTPSLCINTALTDITHTTTGATGIGTATGLPAGVTASWSANEITISGTPTALGTFNYSIPLTGGCNSLSATGSITVTPSNTVSAASYTPTLCINSPLTDITHTTTSATGIGTATGLPAGVTAIWASNTITISGTPSSAGIFTYSIPLTGGCGTASAGGTITVNAAPTAAIAVTDQSGLTNNDGTICAGMDAILTATGGSTFTWGDGSTNSILKVSPTATTSYTVTVVDNNGCSATVNTTLSVNSLPVPIVTSTPPDCPGNTTGTALASSGSGWSYLWSSGATTAGITELPQGLYVVTVTDVNGCKGTASASLVDATTPVTIVASKTDVVCYGAQTGAISLAVTGGTSPYSYAWSANALGSTNDTLTNLPKGNYTVTVTESSSSNCKAVSTIEIIEPSFGMQLNLLVNENSGALANDGTICTSEAATIKVNALPDTGTMVSSYLWSIPGNTNDSIIVNTAGAYSVTVTDSRGCVASATSSAITVSPANTVSAASSVETLCMNTLLTNITHTTTGATGIGTAVGLPAGVTAVWASNTITISGTPTIIGTYNYSIPLTGGCGNITATGTITVTQITSVSSASTSPSLCNNTSLTDIIHTTTGATGIGTPIGLPSGVTALWSNDTLSIRGTPTASGTFNYTIPIIGGCGSVNAIGTINITSEMTVSAGNSAQTLCINTPLTGLSHLTSGGTTGIGTPTGLPAGVTASWAFSTLSIVGTPSESGTFNYSIPLSGGCGTVSATGTIIVTPANTASAASSTPTLCINTPLTNITHVTTGATGINSFTGLPAGVSANWNANQINISGTPTASGVFNYRISLTGGCGDVNATGTITVTPKNTVSAPSSTPTLCINTPLTDIIHTTTTTTGIGTATGLPNGVTAQWVSNRLIILGTPTNSGIFNYTVPLTGGCGSVNATGTITVTPANTVSSPSSTPTLCVNTLLTTIKHSTVGARGIDTVIGLPSGLTASWSSDTIFITGTPTVSGIFRYEILLSGGCGVLNATGTITVTPANTVSIASSAPTLCVKTTLTNITHRTRGATGIGAAVGLPDGVIAEWASDVITISGTPLVSGVYVYSIPLTGGCDTVSAIGVIRVTPVNSASAASSTPTLCINTVLTNITHTTTGATGIGTATGLPAGVSASWATNVITISGTPTVIGTFNYSILLTGGCDSVTATGTITVNPDNTVGAASSTPTLCINTALTNITHTTTGATGIGTAMGLPAGVLATWASNVITVSGTPTDSGTFNYSIPLTGGCDTLKATGTITVNPANTVSAASSAPELCTNTAITNITHTTTGATGIGTATGLPAGVSASWATNIITISGTPTDSGTFNYSIPLTGGCDTLKATGTIRVNPKNTVSSASSAPTVCINTAITNITHTTTGATGIGTATGLPAGVSATWLANVITISGTPTASGTFTYGIPLTGGCDTLKATGTIRVNPNNTVSSASSTPTVCINAALTNITHTTTGATGIGTATGLPAGVSASWATNIITISGTPTDSGTFNYSIPLTGGCDSLSATGTIMVTPANTVSVASSAPTVCINTAITNITHTTTGATGIGTATGLPAGVSAAWASNVITISGTPTASGTFTYSIPLTGGCDTLKATGTIRVNSNNTVSSASSTPTVCINTALTNITHTTTGATGIGSATGLPAGVTAAWASNVITISGTPTASGTFTYSIPLTGGGGCDTLKATGTIRVNPKNTVSSASSTPTVCINTALTNITHTTTGATGIGTATGLPAGVTAAWLANVITISGMPTASGTFTYSIPLTGGCGNTNATGTIIVKATPNASVSVTDLSGLVDDDGTICAGEAAILIAKGGSTFVWGGGQTNSILTVSPNTTTDYSVTVLADDGCSVVVKTTIVVNTVPIPTVTSTNPDCSSSLKGSAQVSTGNGWSYLWSNGSTTPLITRLTQGQYVVTVTDGKGCEGSATATLVDASVPLTAMVSKKDIICHGTATGEISLSINGGSTPYSYAWSSNVKGLTTSSLTNLAAGTYVVTVTEGGLNRCKLVRSIEIVEPSFGIQTNIVLNENSGDQADDGIICQGDEVTLSVNASTNEGSNITSYLWNDPLASKTKSINVRTAGMYSVTVTDSKGCITSVNSTVSVTAINTVSLASSKPSLCINSPLTAITHRTSGATGIGSAVGLPAGVTVSWASNIISIKGTPTVTGIFDYRIPLLGGCDTLNATGTITVNPINTVESTSAISSVCVNTVLGNSSFKTTGATGIGESTGLPAGLTAIWSSNVLKIIGIPTEIGTFNYNIPLTGGCGEVSAKGVISVVLGNTVSAASSLPSICINTPLTNISHTTSGATGIGVATGLPAGVTAVWASNVITLSGTPTQSGIFSYKIPLTGGCGLVSATGIINVKELPVASMMVTETSGLTNNDGIICAGSSAILSATGGSSFKWGSGEMNSFVSVSPSITTEYSVTVTANDGCSVVVKKSLTVDANPKPTVSATNPNCVLVQTGTATASTNASWSYLWSNGATTPAITGLAQGSYMVTVTDQKGCKGTALATLTDTSFPITLNYTKTDVTCKGSSTGAITVNVTGGNSPYVYTWSSNAGGVTSSKLENLAKGSYSVTVTENGSNKCAAVGTIDITEPSLSIQSSISVSENSGSRADDGIICQDEMATLFINALTSPDATITSYKWSDASGSVGQSINVGSAGVYTVTVTDSKGCKTTATNSTISLTPKSAVSAASSTPTICVHKAIPNITHTTTGATGIGAVSGLPSGVSAVWSANVITISGTPTVSGIFTYSIPLTGGCGITNASGTIRVNPDNTVSAASSTPTLCINTALTNITHATTGATGIGTATGLPAGVTAAWSANVITISGTPTASGTFSYSIPLTGGCDTVKATGTIVVNPSITVSAASSSPTLCINSSLTEIRHTVTNAVGIGFSTGLPEGVVASWIPGGIIINGTPLVSGTFNYTISIIGSCGDINATGTIIVTPANTVGIASSTPSLCINTALTNITHTTRGATGIGTAVGLPAGVSARWASNVITISGTPTASGTFNYTIPLTGGCGSLSAKGTIIVTSANDAFIVITDKSGLVNNDGTICAGDEVVLIAKGGSTFIWNGGETSSILTVSPKTTTEYTVSVSSDNGCTSLIKTKVFVNTLPVPTVISTNPNCSSNQSGTALASTGNGWSYLWSNGLTTAGISGLSQGQYIVTVTDEKGCKGTAMATLNDAGLPLTIGVTKTDVICQGGLNGTIKLNVVGGSSPYTYAWSSNAGGATSSNLSNLSRGSYSVTVTEGSANKCKAVSSIEILEPSFGVQTNILLKENSGAQANDGIICPSDIATITVNAVATSGATISSYSWNNASNSSGNSINVNAAGLYIVTVTDSRGCQATASNTLTLAPNNLVGVASSTPTLCIDGLLTDITHKTTGATGIGKATGLPDGVIATWAANTITISGSPSESGTFNYMIPLIGGCGAVNATGSITVKAAKVVSIAVTDKSGLLNNDGTICEGESVVLSATGSSSYVWSGGETKSILFVSPGISSEYSVTATDSDGCVSVAKTIVLVNPKPKLSVSATNTNCSLNQTGSISVSTSSGWSYLWSNGSVSPTISGLIQGQYKVTVTDEKGCSGVATATLTDRSVPLTIGVSKTDVVCPGASDGSISLNVSNGSSPYTFAWSSNVGGSTSASLTNLPKGNYQVTVTESGGNSCRAVRSIEIMEPSFGIQTNIVVSEDNGTLSNEGILCPAKEVTIKVNAETNAGASIRSYLWNNAQRSTSSSITVGAAGVYRVTVTDSRGCQTTASTTLAVTSGNTVSVASSTPTLCVNTVLTNITHTTSGATGIGLASGLPTGVIANWSANVLTISGTPRETGTFNYSIPLTGGCGLVNATGSIIVGLTNTVSAPSSTPTLCVNTALTTITHATTGATGIGVATGLPPGINASWLANTIRLSGSPTVSGTFNYTIPLTGGCGTAIATGTITVSPVSSVSPASSTPTLNINRLLTNITHTTTGISGIGAATGLPDGVSAVWSANVVTISGVPTISGIFNYSIALTGGCGILNATGTITVNKNDQVDSLLCSNYLIDNMEIYKGEPYSGVIILSYKGGNGGDFTGMTISSTGVAGLNLTLQPGKLAVGNGSIEWVATGVPADTGKAIFNLAFGAKACFVELPVTLLLPKLSSLDCNNSQLTPDDLGKDVEYNGVLKIKYQGGNNGKVGPLNLSSTGVAGLTLKGDSLRLNPMGGTLSYTVTGKPTSTGVAGFTITVGDKTCQTLFNVIDNEVKLSSFFTPNGDGNNDRWEIPALVFYPESKVFIFDRTGRLLVEYSGDSPGWDGMIGNYPASAGDYWYVIQVTKEDIRKGNITLIK